MTHHLYDGGRASGRTYRQLLSAPRNALFVWPNQRLDYVRDMARRLGRTDLRFIGQHQLTHERIAGTGTEIVLDHACRVNLDVARFLKVHAYERRWNEDVSAMRALPCLTVRQPWAWAIIFGGKDIENRTWHTNVRGRVLIHAAKGMTLGEYNDACWFALERCNVNMPHKDKLTRGAIIGSVEIYDCVTSSQSPWFIGPVGFALRGPTPLPVTPCKGQLGFWTPPTEILTQLANTA